MKRFVAFGVAIVFALAINVAVASAQCGGCGQVSTPVAAPMTYSAPAVSGCGTSYAAPMAYTSVAPNNCGTSCRRVVRVRRAPRMTRCCQPRTCQPRTCQPRTCAPRTCAPVASQCGGCAQTSYAAPVNNCCNSCARTSLIVRPRANCGCNNSCGGCAQTRYTGTVVSSGCNGCGSVAHPVVTNGCNGCGGSVISDATTQGTIIDNSVIIEPGTPSASDATVEGTEVTPPTPDDT